ncbi:TetR/AcrR family transcriptional regulator [Haloimpatiens massiliensis]|uniref:TetR/AcrR family transcriptional regulator n=1 Tax=Haloimpatiens massiliensis TaxID=1658110 RepID=UPI000C83CE27|nr:TetR/AcrR family transcriptional regulator [Haloimpatiens massiliensis]
MNKTKKAIFESSVKVFSKYGYERATMDEIAANANVAKGTLYYHFKSKQEIFEYIITKGINMIREEVSEVVNAEKTYISRLRELCRVQLSIIYKNGDFFKVIMSQLWGQHITNLKLRDAIGKYIEFIEENLRDAMKNGEVRKGEPKFMAYTFFGVLCSAAVYELINKDIKDVNEVIDNLITYTIEGIGVK